jgi:KDO2-lipid IV(A) lauroyltransferase
VSVDKPSFWQELVWRAEAFGLDLFNAIDRSWPIERMSDYGAWLFRTLGPLTRSHRVAEQNLRLAFPDMAPAERARILDAQWDNLGRVFGEFPQMDRLTPASGRVEVIGGERLDAIRESGRPAVFISGHFANWEVMASVILHYGVRCHITYRAANNPHVDQRFRDSRARYGVKLFAPKGGDGSREILEGFRRGESVALMNDQKFNQGVPAPFFGRLCHTAPGPTRLALRTSGRLQPMSVTRLNGARFRVTAHEPIVLERTNDRLSDMESGVRKVNAFIEGLVRERPEDWFWVHKRWANEAYRALEAGLVSSPAY